MSFNNKIDEWIKEAEARPESALTIVRLVAKRLRELTERNEDLLAENIDLQNGTRVEEYQKRITHLEYQLDLLKRRFGAGEDLLMETSARAVEVTASSLLIYNAKGKIFRVELNDEMKEPGQIKGGLSATMEPPRLLSVPSNGEVLLMYTSGRVSTVAVGKIPSVEAGAAWEWSQAALPDEPRPGEQLACVTPISALPLSDFFMQVSRRGYVKKTMTSMVQSILANHYLGRGVLQKSDQPFDLTLTRKQEQFAFVTYEGHLLGLDIDDLSYTTEQRIRMSATDYAIASFRVRPEETLLCMTQTAKVIQREGKEIEITKSSQTKGQSLIPPARLGQGVRFMGALSVRDGDRVVSLDAAGKLKIHIAESMIGAGTIEAEGLVLSIGLIPAEGGKRNAA